MWNVAFYFWTGLVVTGFFGFFVVWTSDAYDSDLSHTTLFWLTLGGTGLGMVLLLVAFIATAVEIAIRERAGDSQRD